MTEPSKAAQAPHPTAASSGYSLSTLFLLITLFAVVCAHITPLLQADHAPVAAADLATASIITGGFGVFIGCIVGVHHYRRREGALVGMLVGLLFGALTGPIAIAAVNYAQHSFLVSLGGSVLLLGLAALIRRNNEQDPVTQRDVYQAKLNQWLPDGAATAPDQHD